MAETEKNIQVIKELYAALMKGDIASVLSFLSDTVDWQSPVTSARSKEITWSRPRQNRGDVEVYFKELSKKIRFDKFDTTSFTAQDDRVVLEGTAYGTVIPTASAYRSDFTIVFTIRDGKVIRFRQYYDSAEIMAAFHPRTRDNMGKSRLKYVKLF